MREGKEKFGNELIIRLKKKKAHQSGKLESWNKKSLLPVTRVAYPGAVVEQDAHSSVRQLETEAILVGVVDPFRYKERITRHRAGVRWNYIFRFTN